MDPLAQFRAQKDAFFKSDHHSPLTAEQKEGFSGLHYFDDNPALQFEVDLERFNPADHVQIQTNTGAVESYERYGRFRFTIEGEEYLILDEDSIYAIRK